MINCVFIFNLSNCVFERISEKNYFFERPVIEADDEITLKKPKRKFKIAGDLFSHNE